MISPEPVSAEKAIMNSSEFVVLRISSPASKSMLFEIMRGLWCVAMFVILSKPKANVSVMMRIERQAPSVVSTCVLPSMLNDGTDAPKISSF